MSSNVDDESNGSDSTQNEFEVEKIMGKRFNNEKKTYEFLIKWKNWADRFNSWEPAENLNCPHFIDAFEKKAEADRKAAHLQKFGFHRDKDTGQPLLGFEHGHKIETIVGAKFENETLWVLALWAKTSSYSFVEAKEVRKHQPDALFDFYESRIRITNDPEPTLQSNENFKKRTRGSTSNIERSALSSKKHDSASSMTDDVTTTTPKKSAKIESSSSPRSSTKQSFKLESPPLSNKPTSSNKNNNNNNNNNNNSDDDDGDNNDNDDNDVQQPNNSDNNILEFNDDNNTVNNNNKNSSTNNNDPSTVSDRMRPSTTTATTSTTANNNNNALQMDDDEHKPEFDR